ncbi:c-type cytochrome biogenesis protein CcsB [Lysinibacillus sp. FSL M8-0216]|uniref:c-type cytochrome biogenesis protein CcsB n=1 Tax=Lysinibacillus TaxID=400634 RepID=UPI0000F36F81|nr:c-type cytochrome biogenesis protein CcsB [Lysinibacillus fusiformis]EAZ86904.1 cytochrome c biogenesis protein [Bacillus sp. B14905]MED4077051.1 c-type cytochrome biogenesis protein CcsB [Lysinibacillus fusiformis]NOG26175.1 c-type cytochrome biogenesis protein CcsB [Lysinibacillus fusiformis]PCD84687.1 c-type cytochrome biogenesis protein CcsB [Lysinibacillus fusiformis]SCX42346.1 cytochrome c-type biogenesis protein CcsB [Lysinibacillus fusiformis]
MNQETLLSFSSNSLFIAFILLLIAIVPLGLAVKSKGKMFGKLGILLTYAAFVLQLVYFVVRWVAVEHAPVSNMYEFMTFFGIMLTGSYLIIHFLYKQLVVGLFTIPVSLIILGYGSVFAKEVSPLVPSLQSHWLTIHVMTVAFSSAILSVSFATGLIFLLSTLDVSKRSIRTYSLEFVLYCLVVVIGFIGISTFFSLTADDLQVQFENVQGQSEKAVYSMKPLIVNKGAVTENGDSAGLIEITNKIDAKKLNSIVWAFMIGTVLYVAIRLATRKSVSATLKPWTSRVQPQLMDEISYRAVVIGFPLFALGGLLFAMIWAQIAWSRYWGWDPKEVWALITFLFYAAFLHFRLSKGWEGEKTAWLAIIGFSIIVFNQVFVNLVIAGLHSYA